MRPRFTDLDRIRTRARKSLRQEDGFLARWWAEKHGLPLSHEMLMAQSPGAILREMYSDWAKELVQIEDQLDSLTGTERLQSQKRYEKLAELLGETPTVDDWEAMMVRGERPDLSRFRKQE